jgi:hypothetical protein
MRRVLLTGAVGLVVAGLVWQFQRGVQLPLFDFVEYWAAGRLNAQGRNPYDIQEIEELEKAVGRDTPAVLMWNPPWVLPLVMPFGILEVQTAQLLWLVLQFLALVVSADWLWHLYGGDPRRRWVAWLVAFTFLPSYFALTAGQVSPMVLLGTVALLHGLRANRPVFAGISTLLLAIKPHLLLLVFLALLLWSLQERRWTLLASSAATGLGATLIALACNPDVLAQYADALANPPAQYRSPTLGLLLRLWLGDHFWLQFLPPLAGVMWLLLYWRRHCKAWNWAQQLPLVVLVSVLTAAYGAWPFDLVILLVPVLSVAASSPRPRLALGLHLAVNGLALALLVRQAEFLAFVWLTPALLGAFLATRGPDGCAGINESDKLPFRADFS